MDDKEKNKLIERFNNIKVKRGVSWSTRDLEITEDSIRYFNKQELRFEGKIEEFELEEDESKIIILTNINNKKNQVKILAEDLNLLKEIKTAFLQRKDAIKNANQDCKPPEEQNNEIEEKIIEKSLSNQVIENINFENANSNIDKDLGSYQENEEEEILYFAKLLERIQNWTTLSFEKNTLIEVNEEKSSKNFEKIQSIFISIDSSLLNCFSILESISKFINESKKILFKTHHIILTFAWIIITVSIFSLFQDFSFLFTAAFSLFMLSLLILGIPFLEKNISSNFFETPIKAPQYDFSEFNLDQSYLKATSFFKGKKASGFKIYLSNCFKSENVKCKTIEKNNTTHMIWTNNQIPFVFASIEEKDVLGDDSFIKIKLYFSLVPINQNINSIKENLLICEKINFMIENEGILRKENS